MCQACYVSLIFNAVFIGLIIVCALCICLGLWCDNCIDESLEKDRRKAEVEKRTAERERRKRENAAEADEYSHTVKFYSEQASEKVEESDKEKENTAEK